MKVFKKIFSKQYNRGKIDYFAPWARVKYIPNIHTLAENKIICEPKDKFANHIEMAGFYCASIISYGNDENGLLKLFRHTVFPSLRRYPNTTHDSLDHNFKGITMRANGEELFEQVVRFEFDGVLTIYSKSGEIDIKRSLFPAVNHSALIERIEFCNNNDVCEMKLKSKEKNSVTNKKEGADFQEFEFSTDISENIFYLKKGQVKTIDVIYSAFKKREQVKISAEDEYNARRAFLSKLDSCIAIKTPDENLNAMFNFAKIRASESIFKTKAGLMHCPGGGGFYASIWTNDQCEYINPLFGYMGYDVGIEQSINTFALYEKFISAEKPLASSIIGEDTSVWHGAGDRGDSAMYAYGLARFMMAYGDKNYARQKLEFLRQCLAFCLSKTNVDGVIESDSDELENRFESGSANLSTSCICYDALLSASYVEKDLGNEKEGEFYLLKAEELKNSIEKYFGQKVEDFDVYSYCKEEKNLRSWICLPLCVGIFNRADEVSKALLSPKLRKDGVLLTRSGGKVFWDRSALFAMKGLLFADRQEGYELLLEYSKARLLGNHAPYAVEAYPEGNQAQLSAESGLYMRIFIEGILGLRPTGLAKFSIKPNLEKDWGFFEVKNLSIGKNTIGIRIEQEDSAYKIFVSDKRAVRIEKGAELEINLSRKVYQKNTEE